MNIVNIKTLQIYGEIERYVDANVKYKKSLFSNCISYSEFIVISMYEKTSHINTVHYTYIYLYDILYYIILRKVIHKIIAWSREKHL